MIQQVPPNDRNFEIFDGTPGEAKVEAEVTGHAQRAQCVHVAQGSVKFQIVRQVDAGSNAELVMRALTFDGFVRAIVAAGVAVQIHLEVGIARAKPPPVQRLPVLQQREVIYSYSYFFGNSIL